MPPDHAIPASIGVSGILPPYFKGITATLPNTVLLRENANKVTRHQMPEESSRMSGTSFLMESKEPISHGAILGGVGGIVSVLVGYPLDTIKVRLQTGVPFQECHGNLYRGMVSPLMAVVPGWAMSYFTYAGFLMLLGEDSLPSVAAAGALSGACYSLIMCPLDYFKVNSQRHRISLMEMISNNSYGIQQVYRGLRMSLLRDVCQSTSYYWSAEVLNRSSAMNNLFGVWTPFISGAITGVLCSTIDMPIDTIKSNYQTSDPNQCKRYSTVLHNLYIEAGGTYPKLLRRVYRGYCPWILRGFLVHGCGFFVISFVKRRWLDS